MAANTLTPEKSQAYQEKWKNFLGFVRSGTFPPEVYNDLTNVHSAKQWYEFLHKYQSYHFDPQSFFEPLPVAANPTHQESVEEDHGSHDSHGGGHPHHTAQFIDEDSEYQKIYTNLARDWQKNTGNTLNSKEGLDFLYGSLDGSQGESIDDFALVTYRDKFAKNAEYFDKLDEERKKKIEKKPEDDNAFIHAHERVQREYEARLRFLDKQAKEKREQLTKDALKRRNEELKAKIEAKIWKKFAAQYREKALAYAPQHQGIANALQASEGYVPTPPIVQRRKSSGGFIGTVNDVWDQYQNADSLTGFFKNVFFGGGGEAATVDVAETGLTSGAEVLTGEGMAAASELATAGEGVATAAETAVAGSTAAEVAAGGATVAGGEAAGTAIAGGATTATLAGGGAAAGGGVAAGGTVAGVAATGTGVVVGGTGATASAPIWIWVVIAIVAVVIFLIAVATIVVIIMAAACVVVDIPVVGGIVRKTMIDIDCNNSGTTSTTPVQAPIPGLTLKIDGPTAIPNDTLLSYTIKVSYDGSLDVTIFDTIPTNATLVSATGTHTQSGNQLQWKLNENTPPGATISATKDYAFTIVLKPTTIDSIVENKVVARSELNGAIKSILIGQTSPTSSRAIALKSQIDSLLQRNPGNLAVYQEAEKATGVPWQVLGGIHYVEGGMNQNSSLVSGRPIGANEPDIVSGGGCSAGSNAPGSPKPVAGGCGFSTLLDSAIYAGNHLKQKVGGNIGTFEDAVTALSRYNGGGNRNCSQSSDAVNPRTPWQGCPRQFVGEDDPYVLNNFDTRHENMYLVYCGDLLMCTPPKLFGDRLGTMTVAQIVAGNN